MHRKSKLTDTEKARQAKSKAKSMLIIFFDIKGLFKKNSSWQAKQAILHTTVMFYSDCKNV
jgi:hypothetical protein